MQYVTDFEKTAQLPQGSLILQFVRCVTGSSRGITRCVSDALWNSDAVERMYEMSRKFFEKHGCKDAKSMSYWVDIGQGGLAVKIRANNTKLQPDRAVKLRFILRQSALKLQKHRNRDSSPRTRPFVFPRSLLLSPEVKCKIEPKKVFWEVYLPLTTFQCLIAKSSFIIRHSLDLPEDVRQQLPIDSSIKVPLFPFQAAKIHINGIVGPFIASFSGKDSVASLMTRSDIGKYEVKQGRVEIVQVFPPVAMKPLIDQVHSGKISVAGSPLINEGNINVPIPVLEGFAAKILGVQSVSSVTANVPTHTENTAGGSTSLNLPGLSQSSSKPAVVSTLSGSFESKSLPSQESIHEENYGNRTFQPKSVLFIPPHFGKIRVVDFSQHKIQNVQHPAISSLTLMTKLAREKSSTVAVALNDAQLTDVMLSIKKLLVPGGSLLDIRSKHKQGEILDVRSVNMNTLDHSIDRTFFSYDVRPIAVKVPLQNERKGVLCYTSPIDVDVLRSLEFYPIDLTVFYRMRNACCLMIGLTLFDNLIDKLKDNLERIQLLRFLMRLPTKQILPRGQSIQKKYDNTELSIRQSCWHRIAENNLRAVAGVPLPNGRFENRRLAQHQNARSDPAAATTPVSVHTADRVTVEEQKCMTLAQTDLNGREFYECPITGAAELPIHPTPKTAPDLPPKHSAIAPCSATDARLTQVCCRQAVSPPDSERTLAASFHSREMFSPRLCYQSIVTDSSVADSLMIPISPTTVKSTGMHAFGLRQNKHKNSEHDPEVSE